MPDRAQTLLEEADMIEDEASREHMDTAANVEFFSKAAAIDVSSENVAVIMCSDSPHSLGEITGANAQAARLFGWVRKEMIGRPLSMVMPEPIASMHNDFLHA